MRMLNAHPACATPAAGNERLDPGKLFRPEEGPAEEKPKGSLHGKRKLPEKVIASSKGMCSSDQITKSINTRQMGLQSIYKLLIHATLCLKCWAAPQTMEPPSSLEISDPGYLGFLEIKWKPPKLAANLNKCTVIYELVYNSTITNSLTIIQTKKLYYRDAFNLNEEITVKIRASLKSPCLNYSEIWSDFKETVLPVTLKGNPESRIEKFQCIYHNWEKLICNWSPGKLPSWTSNYELKYWYEGLAHTKTCPLYLVNNGTHIGCDFTADELRDYTDIFICVSGTPSSSLVVPSYSILQVQDIVKPGPPRQISISKRNTNEFVLEWHPTKGKIPQRCLIYEIEYKDCYGDWKPGNEQRETSSNITSHLTSCARVRGKVNMFCANDGLWSDWSPEQCWEAQTCIKVSEWMYFCTGGGILVLAGLCVAVTALQKYKVKTKSNILTESADKTTVLP
ncbi:interleukin-13 receptor subunit alpha-2 [Discoglossus pictus]